VKEKRMSTETKIERSAGGWYFVAEVRVGSGLWFHDGWVRGTKSEAVRLARKALVQLLEAVREEVAA